MRKLFSTSALIPQPAFDKADEGGAGGGGENTGAAPATPPADPNAGGEQTPPADPNAGTPPADPPAGDRPDWLLDKYKTPEDQAKAYNELFGLHSRKREEIKAEVREELAKELGADAPKPPETPDGYDYAGENGSPFGEAIDGDLRAWAHKYGLTNDAMKDLVGEVWQKNMPNLEAEKAKLGDYADQMIADVNAWAAKNIDKEYEPLVARIMTTAEGVKFMAGLRGVQAETGFAPDAGMSNGKPLTRDEIREMQADPKFGTDEAYTKMVRGHWKAFAARSQ